VRSRKHAERGELRIHARDVALHAPCIEQQAGRGWVLQRHGASVDLESAPRVPISPRQDDLRDSAPVDARLPQTSPDGRFALRVDEFEDRGSIEANTYLVDLVAQRDVAWLGQVIDGGFRPDGMLLVARPAWNTCDVLIDPPQQRFRIRDDQPWLPLDAWGLAHSAYGQGWASARDSLASDPALAFPWTELSIALGAYALVALLASGPWLDPVARATLIGIGAVVAVAFTWFAGNGLRTWRHVRARDVRQSRR
jgi:hypothetical protein